MHRLVLILFGAAVWMRVLAADAPVTAVDSGSNEVEALVLQLVSTGPVPHVGGYRGMIVEEDVAVPYLTAQVSNALVRLKGMGPAIYPALVKHLGDDRYSFTDISAASNHLTVADAVLKVLSDGHETYSGYQVRKTYFGPAAYLSFKDYLEDRGPETWAYWAKDKTRLQIQLSFIEWCLFKELERGFCDESQRNQLLNHYDRARKEVGKQYSGPGSPANPGQPVR